MPSTGPNARALIGNAERRAAVGVLIVEDDARVRSGLRTMINDAEDLEVFAEAANATQALQQDATAAPDVALVDLLLPEARNGLDVVAELARRGRPVIAMSIDTDLRREGLAAGAAAFVGKGSLLVEELARLIRSVAMEHH